MTDQIHRHATRWSFGDVLWHKMTGEKGLVIGMTLRPQSSPVYLMVFTSDACEKGCLEIELQDEQPTAVTSEK